MDLNHRPLGYESALGSDSIRPIRPINDFPTALSDRDDQADPSSATVQPHREEMAARIEGTERTVGGDFAGIAILPC